MYGGPSFLDRLKSTVSQPWFHGDISKGEAESTLGVWPRDGTYLVRLSYTSPGETPFTLSILTKGGSVVLHQRIGRAGDIFFTNVWVGGGGGGGGQMVRVEAQGGVENLMARVVGQAGLSMPCPGSKLQTIFGPKAPVGGYVGV
jgi:hypothetical protein